MSIDESRVLSFTCVWATHVCYLQSLVLNDGAMFIKLVRIFKDLIESMHDSA